MSITRREFVRTAAVAGASLALPVLTSACARKPPPAPAAKKPRPPEGSPEEEALERAAVQKPPVLSLEPFVDALPILPAYRLDTSRYPGYDYCEIRMSQVRQKVHRDLPETVVWAYGPASPAFGDFAPSWPAATLVHTRDRPARVKWINGLPKTHLFDYAIDPTIMPGTLDVRTTVHMHGGEQAAASDGHPFSAFGVGESLVTEHPNRQLGTTLWYHDHAWGITRLNVYSGLAGFHLLVDPAQERRLAADPRYDVPRGAYDIALAIQDRDFSKDGKLWYPSTGINPKVHPTWVPEFFGTKIAVNGKVWPYLEVEPRRYRFRVLNASQARFYDLRLSNGAGFHQIGSDGGYLPAPVAMRNLVIGPAERCDLVVDFTGLASGTRIVLVNVAKAPFPAGEDVDPKTTGQVMEFRVSRKLDAAVPNKPLPPRLAPIPPLPASLAGIPVRSLFLNEIDGENGPNTGQLGGVPFLSPASETPRVGSTEIWELANISGDTHTIHLHLVQVRVVGRQRIDSDAYRAKALPSKAPYLSAKAFLKGRARGPEPNEAGWKDTVQMHPGEVTRMLVRFAPQWAAAVRPGQNAFPFDPSLSTKRVPGYVWHCHILEHEENDMMRPLIVRR